MQVDEGHEHNMGKKIGQEKALMPIRAAASFKHATIVAMGTFLLGFHAGAALPVMHCVHGICFCGDPTGSLSGRSPQWHDRNSK